MDAAVKRDAELAQYLLARHYNLTADMLVRALHAAHEPAPSQSRRADTDLAS